MKKQFFTLLVLLLATVLAAKANPVDMRTVREVAVKFVNANAKVPLRGTEDLQLVTTYRTESDDAAFHIFNTPNGFVIVSADDCATPILGYSDEGRPFDLENIPIQLQEYLQDYVEQIQYGIENHIAEESIAQQWVQVKATGKMTNNRSYEAVEPLVTALWDQGCYYNAMCPEDPNGYCGGRVPTGCGATAMGMIMRYWGFPTHGQGSLSYQPYYYPEQYVNFGAATYDWANMPNQLDENSTQEEVDAVSLLLWHCGVALHTHYTAFSSSVDGGMVPGAFVEHFNYSENMGVQGKPVNNSEWIGLIKNDLLNGRPIYYIGNSLYEGHGWVCDGFDSENLLHFNWGWGGYYNGYFSLYADLGFGFGFTWHNAIFNIFPNCDSSVTYQITTSPLPSNGGMITGSGTFSAGQVCSLSAIASDGYVFENWTENDMVISTNPDYSFTITRDRHLEAHFVMASTISINATQNHSGWGTVSGAGEYEYGQECLLIAVANEGYDFAYWTESDEVVSMDSAYSFIAVRDCNLVAVFTSQKCNIVFELSSNGYASWGGNYLAVDFGDGTSEQLTLENAVIANYVLEVIHGNTITLSWITGELPSALCFFSVIYEDGQTIYLSPGGYDHDDLYFQFEADCLGQYTPHNITATANSDAMGSVKGAGIYIEGGYCVLVAIPNHGCSFAYWAEDGEMVSDDALYAFSVLADRSLEAVFTMPFSITASSNVENTGNINGTGTYIYNQECTLTAIPNDGFDFMYWIEGDTIVSVDINYTFKVKASRNLIAHFVEAGTTCNIVFELFNIWGEPTSGWEGNCLVVGRDGFFESLSLKDNERHAIHPRKIIDGSTVSLSWIDGNYNYMVGSKFVIHYENGYPIVECTNPALEFPDGFVVSCDEAYLPHVVNAVSMEHGSVSGSGDYDAGDTCLLTAVPEEGYLFLRWTENGVVVSRDAEFAFPVYADRNLVAHFAEIGTTCNMGINLNWFYIWNGNYLVVDYGNGTTEQFTIENGHSNYSIPVVNGSFISLSWIPGFTSFECSFEITYEDGDLLYHGDQLNEDFHYAFVFNCDQSHNINAMTFPNEGGIVEGTGVYHHGEKATLTAFPNEGYIFMYWAENGEVISTDSNYTFTVLNDHELIAVFIEEGNIAFVDDNVKSICVEHWDTDGDGELSYAEAAAVTTLDNAFAWNGEITSFDELQYFINLANIIDYEFIGCYNLSSIVIPNSVTSIGWSAFEGCSSLSSIEIPSSVTSIGLTFNNCPNLLHIYVDSNNLVYDSRDNCNAIIATESNTLVVGCAGTVIPNTVTTIGEYAFYSCGGLAAIEIPNSVNYIDYYAFAYCGLSYIIVRRETPPDLGWGAFEGVDHSIPIYVPCGSLSAYQNAEGWNEFTNIIEQCPFHFTSPGTWSTPTNWQGGALPDANDIVFIDAPCQLDQNAEVTELTVSDGQSLTLQSGMMLTVTGNLDNTATTGLVIEDGAQLVHNVANVQAKVKKFISPFNGTDDGWHLIAIPLTGSIDVESVGHLLEGEYDLYGYDESTAYWMNSKHPGDGIIALEAEKGYLYANGEEVILEFSGNLQNSTTSVTVPLSYTDGAHLAGFNLVGNPFPCNAYLDREYYVLKADGTDIIPEPIPADTPIPPCTAVFVKAEAVGDRAIFTRVTQ